METSLSITTENLVVNMGSNSQQHLPIWRDADGREYVFLNPRAPFAPTLIENVKDTIRRETR